MKNNLLIQFALVGLISATSYALPTPNFTPERSIRYTDDPVINALLFSPEPMLPSLTDIKKLLESQTPTLNTAVINKVLMSIQCANQYNVGQNSILTVIDYSLPSNQKRLWVFDLQNKKLLFHTYVAHGINSGTLLTDNFSNKHDSKASSLGIYKTERSYYGREGLTLKLEGLDNGFNDNAMNRSIVMHGGWYLNEGFIKKYGRPGRSWGCPAIPLELRTPIINTIKEGALFVAYYPSDEWLLKSKFLRCNQLTTSFAGLEVNKAAPAKVERPPILFADLNHNNQREENEPVVVISADTYKQIFHVTAPLAQMLRRQINNMEYIALSPTEFNTIILKHTISAVPGMSLINKDIYGDIYFVIPEINEVRGYYQTQMKILPYGAIKAVHKPMQASNNQSEAPVVYSVDTESKQGMTLRATAHFIRWLGL